LKDAVSAGKFNEGCHFLRTHYPAPQLRDDQLQMFNLLTSGYALREAAANVLAALTREIEWIDVNGERARNEIGFEALLAHD
jgi:hypothetical protein